VSAVFTLLVRILLLPALAYALVFTYDYALGFMAQVLPRPESRVAIALALIVQGFVGASIVAVVFVYPLAFLYRRLSIVIALLMTVPVFILRLPELIDTTRTPASSLVSAYEIAAFAVLLVFGTLIAHRHLSRLNAARNAQAQATVEAQQAGSSTDA
jgi:hypothetical protein